MAFLSISTQPAAGSLHAMMRPIIIKGLTNLGVQLAFADVYINDAYVGSFSATAYEVKLSNSLQWSFDIRSKVQEHFKQAIPAPFNGSEVLKAGASCRVFVKLRDSSNQGGVALPEAPEPVAAIGDQLAIPGGGVKSNEFYCVMATLQHEDNQNFATHLANQRRGLWSMNAWPLTHRPNGYMVLPGRPDSYPFIATGEPVFAKLRLVYRRINRVTWESAIVDLPEPVAICEATVVSATITTNPNGSAVVTYQLSGASDLYWSHDSVNGGSPQGPVTSGTFTIQALQPGTYSVELIPRCSNGQYGTAIVRQYTVSSRPTAWRPRASDAFCAQTPQNTNTGFLVYQTLELVYTDVTPNALTGTTKPNTAGDPDYVPPESAPVACPVPPPPNGGREILGRVANSLGSICLAVTASYYINPTYLMPEIGATLYYDEDLLNPVTDNAYLLVEDMLYTLNSSGIITNQETSTC